MTYHQDLVNDADVDVVAITVKVPYHLELATAALDAGKAVYCEWPLGNGLIEAETLAALAKKKGVLAVAGLQARSAPSVAYVRDLIKQVPRRSSRALGHHDCAPKVLHDRGDGRNQAYERG